MKTYKANMPKLSLVLEPSEFNKVQIKKSQESYEYIKQFWSSDLEIYESFFILLLNRRNNTIGYVKISQGGCTGTVCDVKLIAKYAVESLASSVILAHNHPSGNLNASTHDLTITEKIKNALKLLDVEVLDHLIITADGFTSFADSGYL